MEWQRLLENFVAAVIGGAITRLDFSKYLGDWWLEKVKERHSAKLAELQNAFSMGAASHMATVAFDKHIGFCEEYFGEISKVLEALISEGATYRPTDASRLLRVRQRWALWLTRDIEAKLDLFEADVQRMGADGMFYNAEGIPEFNEQSVERITAYLREILAIEELTALRKELVMRSTKGALPR
jgi:hypothetical protein